MFKFPLLLFILALGVVGCGVQRGRFVTKAMKTIKNVIPPAIAVAFFAALNVQAYFDPSIGRFASRDPIEEQGGLNLYGFVKNEPINHIDDLGLTIVESMHWFPGSFLNDSGCIYTRTMNDGSLRTVTLIKITEDDVTKEEASLRQRLMLDEQSWGKRDRRDEGVFDTHWFLGVGTDRDYYWVKGESEIYADNEINYIGIGTYEAWLGDPKWESQFITWLWKQKYSGSIPPGTWVWLGRGYDDYSSGSGTPPQPPSPPPPPRR